MKTKVFLLFVFFVSFRFSAVSQNVGISAVGIVPDNSAMLDVVSTTRGMLIPRMTQLERNAIVLPATSLLIYQADVTPGYYYNSNTPASPVWERVGTATTGGGWTDDGTVVRLTTITDNVGIGTTTPTYKLHVIGRIKTDVINETSDIRFKKDIQTIDSALAKIEQLRGVYFNWRSNEFKGHNFNITRQMGVVAQEIEKIIPEVVNTDADSYKSVEYSKLVAVLIEAIKEQQKIISNIQNENGNLKADVEKIKQYLELKSSKITWP